MRNGPMVVAAAVLGMLTVAGRAEAVVEASGELRRLAAERYELVVRNTGDESFNQFFFRPLIGETVSSPSMPDARCTTTVEGFSCDLFTLAPGASRTVSFRTDRPYPTNGGGIVFPGQSAPVAGTGFPVRGPAESTAAAPVVGRSELVRPVRGVVFVRRRGSDRFVRLRRGRLLPDGSEIDTAAARFGSRWPPTSPAGSPRPPSRKAAPSSIKTAPGGPPPRYG